MTDDREVRTALVTGGSRGIGRAISERLASDGFRVAVNYTSNQRAADEVVATIASAGGEAVAFQADVSDDEQVTSLFAAITDALGAVTVLVNNAGITRDNLLMRMSPEDWDRVVAVNLRSSYLCTRAALRAMIRGKWGRIVSISSVAGIAGNPGQANYAASKAGLIGFSKSIAKEYGSRGITVNVVAPGFIATDMTKALDDAAREKTLEAISLGRFGEAKEVAAAVSFLVSDEAGYITGQVMAVDGGIAL